MTLTPLTPVTTSPRRECACVCRRRRQWRGIAARVRRARGSAATWLLRAPTRAAEESPGRPPADQQQRSSADHPDEERTKEHTHARHTGHTRHPHTLHTTAIFLVSHGATAGVVSADALLVSSGRDSELGRLAHQWPRESMTCADYMTFSLLLNVCSSPPPASLRRTAMPTPHPPLSRSSPSLAPPTHSQSAAASVGRGAMGQSASKQHQKRITRCMQSFQQLQADIRHINLHCAAEFAVPSPSVVSASASGVLIEAAPQSAEMQLLQFRPFTKLTKKSALPWLWKVNDNVVVSATLTPKSVVDAAVASAAAPSDRPHAPAPLNPDYQSFTLSLREFYHLYLFYVDHVKSVVALREQILKISEPEEWAAMQEAKRQAILVAQQQARAKTPGESVSHEDEEEEKAPSSLSHVSSTPLRPSESQECSICLSVPDEEYSGLELVVLPCMHAFCDDVRTRQHDVPRGYMTQVMSRLADPLLTMLSCRSHLSLRLASASLNGRRIPARVLSAERICLTPILPLTSGF